MEVTLLLAQLVKNLPAMRKTWLRSLVWEDPLEIFQRIQKEGKVYPLHYSVQENSRNCIAHGVAKSRTQLSDFHFHEFSFSQPQVQKFTLVSPCICVIAQKSSQVLPISPSSCHHPPCYGCPDPDTFLSS